MCDETHFAASEDHLVVGMGACILEELFDLCSEGFGAWAGLASVGDREHRGILVLRIVTDATENLANFLVDTRGNC